MFDDVERLRDNFRLVELLSHYAKLGEQDHVVWQNRLMQMDEVEPKELSKLHGELIAFDWIEQNTGQALVLHQSSADRTPAEVYGKRSRSRKGCRAF